MTTYTNTNWGSHIGNAVREGTPLPLFKFRSMSGVIVFRMSGLIVEKPSDKGNPPSAHVRLRSKQPAWEVPIIVKTWDALKDGLTMIN